MARRYDHTREEIRIMAIDAGRQLAMEKGLSGLSARKIAKSIGYTVGTLYNIFDNYDDIILNINGVTLDELHNFMEKKLVGVETGRPTVKAVVDSYIEFATKNTNLWNLLYSHNLPQGKTVPDWYLQKLTKLFEVVEKVLLPSMGNHQKQIKLYSKVLWASIHGITVLGVTGKLDVVQSESIPILTNTLLEIYMTAFERKNEI
jgi:hypothetical protein